MKFKMVDLFAGAGGFSEGFRRVCDGIGVELDLTAINHWPTAVETHSRNHPRARHFCESVFEVDPHDVAPDGYLDCLCASPECIFHSNARGGGPCNEQSRSGAMDILRWVRALNVRTFVGENVREWMDWGPLYQRNTWYQGKLYKAGTPIPHRKGEYFRKFLAGLRSLGYSIDYAVLNSADYGAFTARNRLFLIAYKGDGKVLFPKITHCADPNHPVLKRWHSAREIIDWNLKGDSLFLRQQGLIDGKKPGPGADQRHRSEAVPGYAVRYRYRSGHRPSAADDHGQQQQYRPGGTILCEVPRRILGPYPVLWRGSAAHDAGHIESVQLDRAVFASPATGI